MGDNSLSNRSLRAAPAEPGANMLMQIVADFGRVLRYLVVCTVNRWYVVAVVLVVTLTLAIAASSFAKPQYTSTMMVVPAQSNAASALGSRGAALASLSSSLSTFGLGGLAGSQQFQTYIQVLQSPAVAAAIKADPRVLSGLYAGLVDPKTGNYTRPPGRMRKTLYSLFALTPPSAPSVTDVQDRLNAMLVITSPLDNPNLSTISCTSTDRDECPRLLRFVHIATEAQLSQVTLDDATKMATFIEAELPHVQQEEVRSSLMDLLANATKQIAISQLHQSVGAVIVSPPFTSDQPSFPRPSFVIEVGFVAGMALGIFFAWLFAQTNIDVRVARRLLVLGGRVRPTA